MPRRRCVSCGRNLDSSSYSRNQWCKPVGLGRCHACVNGNFQQQGNSNAYIDRACQSARRNNATTASFNNYALQNPFAEGGFRWVAKGTYTEGNRAGQACVCKWFKTGATFEAAFFDLDIKAGNKALEIIEAWNRNNLVDKLIQINIPEVWTFDSNCSLTNWAGRKTLQEPFIQNYQKFNSNTGWADDSTPWPRVMQALSHFSYHATNGQMVLCDVQGGVYADSVVLTDPVILSQTRCYGVTDLGSKGISSFFSNHQCNEFCRSHWKRPASQVRYFTPQPGTSMMHTGCARHVPTRQSRPLQTLYE